MSRKAKEIAAELDATRARLDGTLRQLRREASPVRLARMGLSQDWASLVGKAGGVLKLVRDFIPGRS